MTRLTCKKCGDQYYSYDPEKEEETHGYCPECTGCPECNASMEQILITESRGEFWGSPCYETIVVGQRCTACDYVEEW